MLACVGGAVALGRADVGVAVAGASGALVEAEDAGAETGRVGSGGAGTVGVFGGAAAEAEDPGADTGCPGTDGVATTSAGAGAC
jgi:hypothetical protein